MIEGYGHVPAGELRERVLREIEALVGGIPQHEITLVLLQIDPIGATLPTTMLPSEVEVARLG